MIMIFYMSRKHFTNIIIICAGITTVFPFDMLIPHPLAKRGKAKKKSLPQLWPVANGYAAAL